MINEDVNYATAEKVLGAALSQHKVGSHGSTEATPLGEVSVTIAGAPRSVSFSERVRDGVTGDNRENLSITIETARDLRATNDGDVKQAVMETIKNLMNGDRFKMPDGKTLADSLNLDGIQPEKITPKFDIVNDGKDNKMHLFLDLPAGVTHWNVVDALAGKDTIALKPAEEVAQKTSSPATALATTASATASAATTETSSESMAQASTLQPVVGEMTQRLHENRTAANENQARGVA